MTRETKPTRHRQTAQALDRVAADDRIAGTEHLPPVAETTQPSVSRRDELIANGTVTPSRARGPLPFEPVEVEQSTAEILTELRTDHA